MINSITTVIIQLLVVISYAYVESASLGEKSWVYDSFIIRNYGILCHQLWNVEKRLEITAAEYVKGVDKGIVIYIEKSFQTIS